MDPARPAAERMAATANGAKGAGAAAENANADVATGAAGEQTAKSRGVRAEAGAAGVRV